MSSKQRGEHSEHTENERGSRFEEKKNNTESKRERERVILEEGEEWSNCLVLTPAGSREFISAAGQEEAASTKVEWRECILGLLWMEMAKNIQWKGP